MLYLRVSTAEQACQGSSAKGLSILAHRFGDLSIDAVEFGLKPGLELLELFERERVGKVCLR